MVGPDALRKSRRDEERNKRSQEEVGVYIRTQEYGTSSHAGTVTKVFFLTNHSASRHGTTKAPPL